MVYRRTGRPSLYFEAKTPHGWKQLCTNTDDKVLAGSIEHMWRVLARRHRAWDLLEPVIRGEREIGLLHDEWVSTAHHVDDMRRRAADIDLEPLVAEWHQVMRSQTGADWADHAHAHVRYFMPAGTPRLASAATSDWLATTLASYPGERNTRRKVHSSLSAFFSYLRTTKKLVAVSPMADVARPAQEFRPPVFYDGPTVKRIVEWQPSAERRAFVALVYGTGADVSPAVAVQREDFNPATKEVRIAGTKTAFRDRIVRISDAMWPTVWAHVKTVISGRVFPASWNRWTVSDWHRQTVGAGTKDTHGTIEMAGLKLPRQLALRKARHHFAVRLLESGASIRVVAEQLGSDERTVLKYYGPWITSSDDRARAEKMATEHEAKRRRAQ